MTGKLQMPSKCVDLLIRAGMDKAQANVLLTRKTELNIDTGQLSLMRTTDDVSLSLTGIRNNRRGTTVINKTDDDAAVMAVEQVVNLSDAGESDPAVDISPFQPGENFSRGPEEPNLDLMFSRLNSFAHSVQERYPTLILEQAVLDHTEKKRAFANSNGVRFSSRRGQYNFTVMFTCKDGGKTSSFNYSMVSMEDMEKELCELGAIDTLMKQSVEQVSTAVLPEAFVGDIIVTPDCLGDFLGTVTGYLGDYSLITGTSIYKDSLGSKIADSRLTLRSMPVSSRLAGGYFFTGDGFKAENSTIIENGVLKSFLLSLYGSRKTGGKRAANSGSFYVVDPGDKAFDDMVKSVDRGLLLCRFSGGAPSSSGDFSGVAKNSYYIENGAVKYPVSETMVAGNIREMLTNVKSISRERVNNGYSIYPWIAFSGITVSGK
ncbi:peptidase [Candidatus Fermentibacteria bacterium]|nr:MAG: peptidase [Candidatus Fermentibacteria bacterium]